MKKGFLLLLCSLMLFGLIGCGGPTEIDINAYVSVEFTGYDTIGQIAEYEFDTKQMKADYEDALGEVSKKTIEKLLLEAISFEDATNLENGDEITVVWDIDEDDLAEFEEENKVKFVYSDFTIEVDGLEEVQSFDPFEKIYIEYEGMSPCGTAYIYKDMSRDDIGYYDFTYSLDKTNNLSNGDTVTVTVSLYGDVDFDRFCIENYGKLPSTKTKTFTVGGLSEYVRSIEDIPKADLTAMDTYIRNILAGKTADWIYPDSFYGMTLMGNVFAEKLYKNDYSSYVENKLYFVYKVDVDNVEDGAFDYYYYGYINNLTLNESGELNYQLGDISVPSGGGWFSSGTTFEYGNLIYEGYKTYDEFVAGELDSLTSKYDGVTNNVDKSIITKVTHEPNDYSVITDVLKLSADCFTYKWYLGSYFVSGLTQKGYDEVMKYTTSDYVSIQLPANTEDGSVVEGFYSSGAEGGYAFSKLVNKSGPRFELVCADNYITFYGFCDDSRFDSSYLFKMKNIQLNSGLKEIKANAFLNCSALESISLPEGLEVIPEAAFKNCSGLKEITIPASVTEIQNYAFENCTSLIFDSFELGTVRLGYNVFDGVTINKLTLGSNDYTSQREYSWGTTYNSLMDAVVKELVISEGVTKIPEYAFEGVKGLTQVTLPQTVTEIGTRAFASCADLATVTLQEGLETIGVEAFYDCNVLVTANIPSSVSVIEDYAFKGCELLNIDRFEIGTRRLCADIFDGATILEVVLDSEECILEREYSWYTLYAPFNNAYVKKITIGENITKIPDYAFEEAEGLAELVIPATVKEIGVRAFAGCPDLTKVTLSEGLETIGVEAFNNCSILKTVNIPDSVTVIDDYAFCGCELLNIDYFEIGTRRLCANIFDGVTIQEVVLNSEDCILEREYSWYDLYSPFNEAYVKKITINDNITKIPDYAFEEVEGLTELVIPATVKEIGVRAFAGCPDLTKVTLSEGLEVINPEVFNDCNSLKTINIPDSVTVIEEYAFAGCELLCIDRLTIGTKRLCANVFENITIKEVVLDSEECVIEREYSWYTLYAPFNETYVKSITIGENVTKVPDYIFEGAIGLTDLVIPANVEDIGVRSFAECDDLLKVTLPDGLKTIGVEAFESCNKLRTVNIPASVKSIGEYAFYDITDLWITTPSGSKAEEYAKENGINVKN